MIMFAAISPSLIVDGSLWLLAAFSIATWSLILIKAVQHGRVVIANRRFAGAFWRASSLPVAAGLARAPAGPAARLAHAGFRALDEAAGPAGQHDLAHSGSRQELLERYLRQQIQKEKRRLESGLSLLASIGSTAPFVGLFGTVWGIMHALTEIGRAGSATLDVVAGPIGEALVATGIGIAVAVPAVLGYNLFLRRLKLIWADLDDFANDFVNLARRSAFRLDGEGV
jgi:biopolymer transport protein ExbB